MSKWSGRYSDTKESKESLDKDLERAGEGKFVKESSDGGTVREQYNIDGSGRIDVYSPSNSSKGHSHDYYDSSTGKSGHHD